MLNIKNITKYYKSTPGIIDLSLTINEGEIYGFIGPNGAGKSTTIRSILNFINISKGTITINNKNHTDKTTKIEIGYLPGEINLYDDLTVLEMFKYNNNFYKKNYINNAVHLAEYLELDTNKKIDTLSLGNLKKVGIILALMHEPKILILDEPTSGLDPLIQKKFYELILKEKKKGTTIFFSSHILSEVKQICDRVGIVKDNKLIKELSLKELNKTNGYNIQIYSKDIEEISKELKVEIKNNRFTYKKDINKLINTLQKYNIEQLYIKEEEIENIFMEFYGEQNDK